MWALLGLLATCEIQPAKAVGARHIPHIRFCGGSMQWQPPVFVRYVLLSTIPEQADTAFQPALKKKSEHIKEESEMYKARSFLVGAGICM